MSAENGLTDKSLFQQHSVVTQSHYHFATLALKDALQQLIWKKFQFVKTTVLVCSRLSDSVRQCW